MANITLEYLNERLELAEQLRLGREVMLRPQDLPGRYGRVVQAVDRVLASSGCESVLAGGWAVWRHGYVGRVTQDLDIALAADQVEEFLRVASVAGFEVLLLPPGRWPKLKHKDTGVEVDVLPEKGRPGSAARPAPTTIPHPSKLGAAGNALTYITLPGLIELKLAAGRARDDGDVVELLRANCEMVEDIRRHLAAVHDDYVSAFEILLKKAQDQRDA